MVKRLLLKMDTHMRVKGYLMLEMLVVLMIISTALMIYLPRISMFDYTDYRYGNNLVLTKSEAMRNRKEMIINDAGLSLRFPLYFTANGNVNQAQTIVGNKYNLIVHLGNGYLTYE